MLKIDRPEDSQMIEDRIVRYLWDKFDDECKEEIITEYKAGPWDALSTALMIAANTNLYIPEDLLKEAEEAAMEFIDFHHGKWAYFVLDPIEDIRVNNAKLLAEGKALPDADGEASASQ